MLCKTKNDSANLGIQLIDLTQIFDELINWRRECCKESNEWEDPVRVAMIDSFEDIILNALVEGD